MLQPKSAVYTGKEFEEGYMGYFVTPHCFLILAVEEGLTTQEGEEILQAMKSNITHAHIHSLSKFDAKISELFLQLNLPMGTSLAAGLLHEQVLYVKTTGKGQIYMRRGKDVAKLIGGDNSASGYVKQFDCLIFTTARLNGLLGNMEDIQSFIELSSPEEIVENLSAQQYDEEDTGVISLFVELLKPETRGAMIDEREQEMTEDKASELESRSLPSDIDMDSIYHQDEDIADEMAEEELSKHIRSDYQQPKENLIQTTFGGIKEQLSHVQTPQIKKSKKLTMIAVGIIFVILIWSVVFGYQRRAEAQITKKVETTKEVVQQKITEAEEDAFLNLERSLSLLGEAKAEIDNLKQDVGDKRANDIKELVQMVKNAENAIVKKEEKSYEEYYDLTLENQDAKGSVMYVDGENVAILDEKEGRVYVLSLEKKSLQKKTAGEASAARLITMAKDRVYILGGNGVHEFTSDTKVKRVIEYDDEWGEIASMFMYNGNLYMLDPEKNDIYKYSVTQSGFSTKSSYLQTDTDVSAATSIAIDSSVYIADGNTISKFTRGAPDEFKTTFPTNDVKLTKVYTNVDIEKLYAWDKNKGIIYIVNKSGAYERQLKSEILTKATDFFVYKNEVYILSGSKIYKMSL